MTKNNHQQNEYSATTLVSDFINQAINSGASDLHIEPEAEAVRVRLRVDGIMLDIAKMPLPLLGNLISRIKVIAQLDISETRLPQDGRFEIHRTKTLDLRVSIFPTIYGECAVIRLLDRSQLILSFNELGFAEDQVKIFQSMIKKPYGLILVCGPTSSGKTTTLFSILNVINSSEKCIVTLEDPVEYHLPLLRQTQIDERINFSFAQGLRSLFRQNPDVIMVGEIRDNKTADIAIQAAMSGHLVLSTLHTNDSVGALIRLREMGLEKFLITSATSGIVAQRLIRKICQNCKQPDQPEPHLLQLLDLKEAITAYKGAGCELCRGSGFIGRTGIFEILRPSPEINKLVYRDVSWRDLHDQAAKEGLQTLRQSGIAKIQQGITTVDEVIRVTQ
jgi:type IV pilus assembly protein PilB